MPLAEIFSQFQNGDESSLFFPVKRVIKVMALIEENLTRSRVWASRVKDQARLGFFSFRAQRYLL